MSKFLRLKGKPGMWEIVDSYQAGSRPKDLVYVLQRVEDETKTLMLADFLRDEIVPSSM